MALLPMNRKHKLLNEHKAITDTMGMAVPLLNALTEMDDKAPIVICMPPINAEALPAFFSKGAIDRAEVLGKIKP